MVYKTTTRRKKKEVIDPLKNMTLRTTKIRFMGIDQSLSCTGVVMTNLHGHVIFDMCIPTNKKSFPEARINHIGMVITSLLESKGNDLLFVAIENLAFGGSGKIDILAGVYWEIRRRVWCYNENLEIYSVPIGTWKKWIAGHGRATKPMIRKSIIEKYDLEFDNENKYDAYGLLRYQIAVWKGRNEKNN